MRNSRIYQPGDYQQGSSLLLTEEASRHVAVVLRMLPGQRLTLFCGDDCEYEALITSVNKKKVALDILSVVSKSRESPLAIDLAQAVSKGERMEFVVQKAVELGVRSIIPVVSSRSVVKLDAARATKKLTQWQAIAVAACEQSGRNQVPVIRPVISFADYLTVADNQYKFILLPDADYSWRDYTFKEKSLSLLVGPEGGFTDDEVNQAKEKGFAGLSLGPRILRTETAPVVAMSILQAVGGDL